LVNANINEEQSTVICSLSSLHPSSSLNLCYHADSEPTFLVEVVAHKPTSKQMQEHNALYSVHLSGFVDVSAEDEFDDEDDEQEDEETEDVLSSSHALESHIKTGNKRQRAAISSLMQEEDDDENEEADHVEDDEDEDAHDVAPASKAQKTADGRTPKPAAAGETPNKPKAKALDNGSTADKPKSSVPAAVRHANGLIIQDDVVGSGAEAVNGKMVSIRYRGELVPSGKVFDSNMPRGKPFAFKLGAGECIKGFDLGVKGMRVNGRRSVTIPPALGYGKSGAPPDIPPNSTLKFLIELLKA